MGVSSRYSKKRGFLHLKDPLQPKLGSKEQYKQVLKNLSGAYEIYNPSSLDKGVNQRSVDDESLLPLIKLAAELAAQRNQQIVATKPLNNGENLPKIASSMPRLKEHHSTPPILQGLLPPITSRSRRRR